MDYFGEVKEAADAIRARLPELPSIGIVLGSGLGDFANTLGDPVVMPYDQLPHWPAPRVIGHEGKLRISCVRQPRVTGASSSAAGSRVSPSWPWRGDFIFMKAIRYGRLRFLCG